MQNIQLYLDLIFFTILGAMMFIALWITFERLFLFKRIDVKSYQHIELLNIDITKNLTTLSTIGANAPYVGLLGTVIGILITFYEIGMNDSLETAVIMTGLALALKLTAAGIAVAIPALMFYNGLLRKVEELQAKYRVYQDLSTKAEVIKD
ncbi:TonB-system energizer ExbB [Thiomicrospira cyclica]|uniref:TonB-system energizer ExbB n=1 Tax=Thiomicrospira cyclica (strain DSM 14477 / JCM 11371 / ALM1) TaxID=717773 RepID=F6DBB3_THICA|nr:TonB-system energizer ExbB [Thiomicrospira cyclica]AEG31221.1 tonB-system energizer ExbB [Thiomicrospira cyclica ALM1]